MPSIVQNAQFSTLRKLPIRVNLLAAGDSVMNGHAAKGPADKPPFNAEERLNSARRAKRRTPWMS